MFEESEWQDEGAAQPAAAAGPPHPAPPQGPAGARSRQQRQRLLATLRRLQGCARRATAGGEGGGSGSGSGSASDSEPAEQPGRKRCRRGPEPGLAGRKGRRKEGDGAPLPARLPGEAAAGNRAPVAGDDKQKSTGATTEGPRQTLTRKQWRNRQKNKKRQKNKFKAGLGLGPGPAPSCQPPGGAQDSLALSASPAEKSSSSRAASLRLRMEERLDAARFRYLNQLLYTCPSQKAARLFQEDPESFAVYHRGFARQVARWPESPVQRLVHYLRNRPASLVVADFGCGDCTLARSVRNQVHCFDLIALDPRVTVCDMAQVPLEAESVDVVVFCLALMGTNLREILEEASRVLRLGGTLLVAEVASRFPDVRAFVGALAQLGFKLLAKDISGSHFYTFEFRKAAPASPLPADALRGKPLPGLALRPCLYKRR